MSHTASAGVSAEARGAPDTATASSIDPALAGRAEETAAIAAAAIETIVFVFMSVTPSLFVPGTAARPCLARRAHRVPASRPKL